MGGGEFEYYTDKTTGRNAEQYLNTCTQFREALDIPRGAHLTPTPLGHGEHNENYTFVHPASGEKLVLRINRESSFGLEDQAAYEADALHLAEQTGRAPRNLFHDSTRSCIDYDVSVLTYCEGRLSDFRKKDDLRAAAQILADIHSVAVPEQSRLKKEGDMVPALIGHARRNLEEYRASKYRDEHVVGRMEKLFGIVEGADCPPLRPGEGAHLLHGEPIFDHFIIAPGKHQAMIIDWDTAACGEVARDVLGLLTPTSAICGDFLFTREGMDEFIGEYWDAVGGRFEPGSFFERLPMCEKASALAGLSWALHTTITYNEGTVPMRSPATWQCVLTYLSDDFLDMEDEVVFGQ